MLQVWHVLQFVSLNLAMTAKREKCIVLLRAFPFRFQLKAWRSTMQSVWQDLSRTETRRLRLTSHPHAAIWNKRRALRVISLSLSLTQSISLSLTLGTQNHSPAILWEGRIWCSALCVPISPLLWQQRCTQACDWLSPADGKAAHWLAAAVWVRCSFALAATWESALTVWVCLLLFACRSLGLVVWVLRGPRPQALIGVEVHGIHLLPFCLL